MALPLPSKSTPDKAGDPPMTFSSRVKNELCQSPLGSECCARAEVYGALLHCNTFTPQEVRVITESESFARRLPPAATRGWGRLAGGALGLGFRGGAAWWAGGPQAAAYKATPGRSPGRSQPV